jgi:hypothetical protein
MMSTETTHENLAELEQKAVTDGVTGFDLLANPSLLSRFPACEKVRMFDILFV